MQNFVKFHTVDSPHLKENKMTYIQHMKFSISLTSKFLKGTFCGLIHSFLPNYFVTSSSDFSTEISTIIDKKRNLKIN